MIEINLIPDVKQELLRAQRTRATVITASIFLSIAAVGVVALLALYIFGVQAGRGYLLDNGIKDGYAKLSKVEDLSKILTIQNQLAKISELNDQKNIDSRLFDVLSAVIPPAPNSVQISQIDLTNSGDSQDATGSEPQIRLEGQTADFSSMEVFKKTIDNAIIQYTADGEQQTDKLATNISVSDISYGADASNSKVVRFTLTFTYSDKLFSPTIKNPTFKLQIDGNVTDSYLGIPKSIFTERAKDIQ